ELDAMHELRIGQTVLACPGIDPLDPQRAEVALAVAPIAVGVLQPLLDPFDRDPIGGAAAAPVALGEIEDFLVAGVGRHAALDARHASPPPIGHISQDELCVAPLQGRRAARLALHLLWLSYQPMAFVAVVYLDLAA